MSDSVHSVHPTSDKPVPRRRLVSQARAGRHIQKSERTIRRWIGEGYITGYRVGPRTIMVDLDEIEAQFRIVPVQKMRDGRKPYGPKAKIVNLPNGVPVVQDSDR